MREGAVREGGSVHRELNRLATSLHSLQVPSLYETNEIFHRSSDRLHHGSGLITGLITRVGYSDLEPPSTAACVVSCCSPITDKHRSWHTCQGTAKEAFAQTEKRVAKSEAIIAG